MDIDTYSINEEFLETWQKREMREDYRRINGQGRVTSVDKRISTQSNYMKMRSNL